MNISMEQACNIQCMGLGIAAGITLIADLMTSLLIVAVNVTDWMKRRPVATTDQILTSLGITRMFYQFVCLLDLLLHIFLTEVYIKHRIILQNFQAASFYSSMWISSLLSVVFFLKISNFHNVFFLRLKIIILQKVVRLIVASVLVSIFYTCIVSLIANIEMPKNSTMETYKSIKHEIQLYVYFLWNIVPFLMFLVSSVFLISSLCHHMNRMRCDRNVTGHLDTYYKTITFTTFSIFNFAFYFCVKLIAWFYYSSLSNADIYFLGSIFPTLYSIYLIYVTTKLRNRLFGFLRHGSNCLINRRGSEPISRDPLQTVSQKCKESPRK